MKNIDWTIVFMNICAVIPSYDPDEKLHEVVNALTDLGFNNIIIVDDGNASKTHFDELKDRCTILTHCKNFGKGRGMKTAINYIATERKDIDGVVFVDGDNQHKASDVLKCCECLEENPNSIVLGVRDFNGPNTPKANRAGNKITSFIFKALCGINISDTQTGLRAMSIKTAVVFSDTLGERFEYETNMLLTAHQLDIPFKEVVIQTVYIGKNTTSHFRYFHDSVKIYSLIVKYISSSIISTVIDVVLFMLFVWLFRTMPNEISLLIATVVSRVISSITNYFLNHKVVFKSKARCASTIWKYYILCAVQMCFAYGGVFLLVDVLQWQSLLSKIIVDFLLFLVSFQIQREWVFRKDKK